MWSVGSVSELPTQLTRLVPVCVTYLAVLGLALIHLKLSLDTVLWYWLNRRQECIVTCRWEVQVFVCTGSDLFVTLLSVREHTPHGKLLYPCPPDFHSDVFSCFMPHQVKYTSEAWLDFYTVLLWAIYYFHGMAKREAKNHTWAFQALLRWSCKTPSCVVVCLHHVSPFSFSYSNSLGFGVYFLQE